MVLGLDEARAEMVQPYSQDLRERVMLAVDDGTAVRVVAPLFRVSVSYIYKALGRDGERPARQRRGDREGPPSRNSRTMATLLAGESASIRTPHWPSCRRGCRPSAA